MYKIWQGQDAMQVLTGLAFFLGCLAMVLHIFAFSVVGYPKTTKAKYNATAAAVR
jgi:hypothetical protein